MGLISPNAETAGPLTRHGLLLEMLSGPLPGIYDPSGAGKFPPESSAFRPYW